MFMLKRRSTIRRQEKRKPTHGGPYLHVKRRASAKRRAGHHQKPLPETHGHKLRRVTLVLPPPSIRGQFAATRPPPHHPPSTHPPPSPALLRPSPRSASVECSLFMASRGHTSRATVPADPSPSFRPFSTFSSSSTTTTPSLTRRACETTRRKTEPTSPSSSLSRPESHGTTHRPRAHRREGTPARTRAPRPPNPTRPAPATAAASRTRRRPSTADACRNTCPAAPGATRNVGRTSGEDQRAHCPSDTNKLRILCPHGDELGSGLCRLTARSGPTVRKGSYITPFPYRPVRFHACLVRPAPW